MVHAQININWIDVWKEIPTVESWLEYPYSLSFHISMNECKDRWLERQMDRGMDERDKGVDGQREGVHICEGQ